MHVLVRDVAGIIAISSFGSGPDFWLSKNTHELSLGPYGQVPSHIYATY